MHHPVNPSEERAFAIDNSFHCSISTALSMTYAGARGRTASEMRRVLGFRRLNVHNIFRSTLKTLRKTKGQYTLAVANRLFAQRKFKILKTYKTLLYRKYFAGLDVLDFSRNPSRSAAFINRWIKKNTNNKIKKMVKASEVRNAILILANAIYFKGFWEVPFNKKYTRPGIFNSIHRKKKVPMMHLTAEFAYSKNRYLNCQILELPYKGTRLSMYVFLPNKRNGLNSLEKKLNYRSVTSALDKLYKRNIAVTLPKFKMTMKMQLRKVLMAMGMRRAFAHLDFSGIAKGGGLKIGNVIHKAFIKVDEKGTEAAAASVVILTKSARPRFVADHPFLFLIRDNRTGSILFLGRLVKP